MLLTFMDAISSDSKVKQTEYFNDTNIKLPLVFFIIEIQPEQQVFSTSSKKYILLRNVK